MKKITASIFFLLLINFFAVAQNNNTNIPLISVEGEGEVKVDPDQVTLNFGIETRANTAKEATNSTNQKVRDILKFLNEQGIENKNINTDFVRLNPQIDYQNNRVINYIATQSISVLLKDIKAYEKIMTGLLENGINNIYNINFGSSRFEEYKDKARAKAMKSAQGKAKAMAGELGQSIGKAHFIDETSIQAIPIYKQYSRVAEMQEDSGESPSIAPGQMSIKANVRVSFVLE